MKRKLKKVGIWGQYGDGGPIADGQAVRTTITTEELIKKYGKSEVEILNTNAWKKHPFNFFVNTVRLLKNCENVLILPADNGLRIVAPIYDFFNRFFKHKILYIVIGGFLPEFLKNNPSYVKMLNKYECLFVQTPNLKNDLKDLGLKHIELMTNFKLQSKREPNDIVLDENKNISVCVLSRLTEDKGIEDAIEAVKIANAKLGNDNIHLDLYGIVPNQYQEKFDKIVKENENIVTYKGVVNYNETASHLKKYFALLFPTYFHGEGFAGCLIDAFFAGIPVIATDWLYNKDIIKNNVNGILVPIQSPQKISEALLDLYFNRELALEISKNNAIEAKKYTAENVLAGLYNYLDK